ncbi:MAG: GGDEF domain-containing protein, partial [Elusimicrobia bacterium]|nr:GGDEF domain-containing protein [Elusimicrobiota bacterium]
TELHEEKVFYWYMGVGTVLSFAIFGYLVGARSERQRARNAALRTRVRELHLSSITDGLTGAFSHAYLQEALQLELEASRRSGRPVSVLMLDLDDFKKLNDTHGHLFGDRVLREVTETIAANIRQADVLGRYGGEEFAVIMPGADPATAVKVAERVRLAVSRSPISPPHAAPVPVRLSIGAATTADGQTSAPDLIRKADENLYRAKNGGKNRTVGSGETVKTGP